MQFNQLGAFVLIGNLEELSNSSEGILINNNSIYRLKLIPFSEQSSGRANVELSWSSFDPDDQMSYQPLNSNLTSLAAATLTEIGLELLSKNDANSIRSLIEAAAAADLSAHESAADPHSQYVRSSQLGSAAYADDSSFAPAYTGDLASGAIPMSAIGSTVQAYDSDLAAIAALSTTAFGRGLLTLIDAAAARAAIGAASADSLSTLDSAALKNDAIGSTVQAYDSDLAAIAALATTSFGRGLLTAADAAAARSAIGAASSASGAGKLLQIVSAAPISAAQTITGVIPYDDTIPQSNEGTEIFSISITPQKTDSKLIFNLSLQLVAGMGGTYVLPIAALFAGAGTDAIRSAVGGYFAYNEKIETWTIRWVVDSPGLTATTYKVRVGMTNQPLALNAYWTGAAYARRMGGSLQCTFDVTEISP